MTVSFNDVEMKFKQVLNNELSREGANDWAYNLMQKLEVNDLLYVPPSDKEKIWDGIIYLYGVDLLETPGNYFHSMEDILETINALKDRK